MLCCYVTFHIFTSLKRYKQQLNPKVMTTERILTELKNENIPFTGCYSKMPEIVLNGINTVKAFGFEYWTARTTAGAKVKEVVKRLSMSIA